MDADNGLQPSRTQLDHLVEAALLRTERASLPRLPDDSPLVSLMLSMQQDALHDGVELDDSQQAFMLLRMAGAIGLYEQVGQQPQRMSILLVPRGFFTRQSLVSTRKL